MEKSKLDPYKNYWQEFPVSSDEYERGKDWKQYELWQMRGRGLIDELSRYISPFYLSHEETEKSWAFQALREILATVYKMDRRLKRIEKRLSEMI